MTLADGPVIIGGGPSGLAAAIDLRRLGIGPVTVIEREPQAGGIPRHSDHTGFGLRDLHTVLSGPRYAERYRELAADAGVDVVAETMVTDWEGERGLKLTGPDGRREIEPPAVILATGCRERPRSARLVPGSRPAGVMTTSTLQQLVHLRGEGVGRRAVIVGAEHVSFSAVATLAHAGASVAGLVTELPKHQSLAAFRAGAAVRYRAPVWSRTAISAIHGAERVESVELTELDSGSTRIVECDLVIFTADWIPDHELAVMAGCELDPGSLGPLVGPGSAHDGSRRIRRRESAPSGRDRRHLRARRSPRRAGGRGLPARSGGVAVDGPAGGARPARLGRPEPAAGRRPRSAPWPLSAPLTPVHSPGSHSGPAGRATALEGAGRPSRPRPLCAHPGELGSGGRSGGRARDRRCWVAPARPWANRVRI